MRADNAIGNLAKPLWGTTRPHAARINSSITGIVACVLSTLPDVRAVIALHRVYAHRLRVRIRDRYCNLSRR